MLFGLVGVLGLRRYHFGWWRERERERERDLHKLARHTLRQRSID